MSYQISAWIRFDSLQEMIQFAAAGRACTQLYTESSLDAVAFHTMASVAQRQVTTASRLSPNR